MREPSDFMVLDTVADDLEEFSNILARLNRAWRDTHPAEFTDTELMSALARCIRDDLVEACSLEIDGLAPAGHRVVPPTFHDAWFRITERGKVVHANWEPPTPKHP